MTNSNDCPLFIQSILKVTASEDIDINQDLTIEDNSTIDELLLKQQQNAKEE